MNTKTRKSKSTTTTRAPKVPIDRGPAFHRLAWERTEGEGEQAGCVHYWASVAEPHEVCFNITVRPLHDNQRYKTTVEFTAWIGPDDTPLIDETVQSPRAMEDLLAAPAALQNHLVGKLADKLQAQATHVHHLISL